MVVEPSRTLEWPAKLKSVLEQLVQPDSTLSPCGSPVLALLSRLYALLLSPTPRSLAQATHLAAHLLRLANDLLNAVPYKDVPLSSRRLYTDAALLGALARLALAQTDTADGDADEAQLRLRDAVRDCDLAIVVAGAPGARREDLALELIELAQARLRASAPDDGARPAKRARVAPPQRRARAPAPYVDRPMPTLPSLPSFLPSPSPSPSPSSTPSSTPSTPSPSTPFLVRAALADSDAVARWASLAYLRAAAGPARVVPVEVGGDYTAEGWGQRMMDFGTFVDALERADEEAEEEVAREGREKEDEGEKRAERPETLYLAQHALFRQLPALRRDLPLPDLVYSPPALDDDGAPYVPPHGADGDGVVLNAWLGPGGTTSRAHTDPFWNCYVQVVGSKWIWVAPPDCAPHMAAFGSTSGDGGGDDGSSASASGETCDVDGQAHAAQSYMTNTSTLDVTVPPPPRAPSPAAYPPAFLDQVVSRAFQAVLEPGDVLVLPPRWWHSLVSLETSFSVSMWF